MAKKIMLVEDDTNLSEIYKARLEAESFQVISAKDGEEALAIAVKEHPDLIISDVMMPKISGFDMLDILRGTEGVQNTKVIMMTALGQNEDKARADKLGADRYLVKSQVTLEDVVKAVHEVLEDIPAPAPTATPAAAPIAPTPAPVPMAQPPAEPTATAAPAPVTPAASAPEPVSPPAPTATPPTDSNLGQSNQDEKSEVLSQIQDFVNKQEAVAKPGETASTVSPAEHSSMVIQPPVDTQPDVKTLVESEPSSAPSLPTEPSTQPPATAEPPANAGDPNKIAL